MHAPSNESIRTWSPGDVVIRRDLWNGRPWYVVALLFVEECDDLIVTYAPHGSGALVPKVLGTKVFGDLAKGSWQLHETTRYNHTLGLWPRGAAHSHFLFWSEDWEFLGWYVNLEEPHTSGPHGFDTCDYMLDVVIAPDLRSWRWKDEDHLQIAIDVGLLSTAQAQAVRAEGERVIQDLED